MTLAELSRIAQTRGDEYRWIQAAHKKERAEEAATRAEETRLRRQAKAQATPRYSSRPRTTPAEPGEQSVAMTTPPQGGRGGKASSFQCSQCNQPGHWAEESTKLDPRLCARLTQAQSTRWATDKLRPGRSQRSSRPTGPPVVATTVNTATSSGSESPREDGEACPRAVTPVESFSRSEEGNE